MKHRITLLAVEDSMSDFLLLKETLKSSDELDVEIVHEDRLEGAISAASARKFDVAVIDLSLPDSFGLETFVSFHKKHPLLPICPSCKKIRDDKGYWNLIEANFSEHSDVQFSHGICPDCIRRLYPNLKVSGVEPG